MASKCPDPMLFSAYIDGELPEKKWLALALHLEKCPACRKKLADLQQVKTMVASLPQRPAPSIRIGQYSSPPRRAQQKWFWPASLAAAAVLLLILCLNFRQPQVGEVAGEYLRIHRQYEQQIAQNSQRIGEILEEGQ